MFARRRPLARAAVVGGTAYVAGKAGAKAGANQAAEQQQEYAPPPPAAAPAPAPGGGMSEDSMAKLKQLADLHEQGILTDAEFEVQKQKILQGM
jgi:putative oligomerization/nucleic acid binding protein